MLWATFLSQKVSVLAASRPYWRAATTDSRHFNFKVKPRDSSFLMPKIIVGGRPFPHKICAESDPPPFEHNDFDQYWLIAPQPWLQTNSTYIQGIYTKHLTQHKWFKNCKLGYIIVIILSQMITKSIPLTTTDNTTTETVKATDKNKNMTTRQLQQNRSDAITIMAVQSSSECRNFSNVTTHKDW